MAKRQHNDVQSVVDEILTISQQITALIEKRAKLYSRLQVQDQKPEPPGFDYRAAVLDVFQENSGKALSIDDVVRSISLKNQFSARKDTVTNRMNYLADKDRKLERIEGRRGYYRMTTETSG